MTINSMTGFGRSSSEDDDYTVTIEIKSVNHRFFDFKIKQPGMLSCLDLKYRSLMKESFKRNSFDISIHLKKKNVNSKADEVDWKKVNGFILKFNENIDTESNAITFSGIDFLRNEFMLEQNFNEDESLHNLVLNTLSDCRDNLFITRTEEGEKLVEILSFHVTEYEDVFTNIVSKAKLFEEQTKENILKKFEEHKINPEIEKPRFMQEVIYYLEKNDIHEEINRIQSHLEKLKKVLKSSGPVGRELEFVLQELNRETNTIGSKSSKVEISDSVVKMKIQLEKMREQSLNLE